MVSFPYESISRIKQSTDFENPQSSPGSCYSYLHLFPSFEKETQGEKTIVNAKLYEETSESSEEKAKAVFKENLKYCSSWIRFWLRF